MTDQDYERMNEEIKKAYISAFVTGFNICRSLGMTFAKEKKEEIALLNFDKWVNGEIE